MPRININAVAPYIIACLQFYAGKIKCNTGMIKRYVNKHSRTTYTDRQIRDLMNHHQGCGNTPWWKETVGDKVYWTL